MSPSRQSVAVETDPSVVETHISMPAIARQMAVDADPWPAAHQLACTAGLQAALCSALTIACPDWADDLFRPGPV
jgi:hypothetical protein